jgi:hypothetical protein
VLERQAGARPDLHFKAFGNGDREAGRHGVALPRRERQILSRDHVEAGRPVGCVARGRQALSMVQPLELDFDQFDFLRAPLRPPFFAGP